MCDKNCCVRLATAVVDHIDDIDAVAKVAQSSLFLKTCGCGEHEDDGVGGFQNGGTWWC